jgi:hypothetical protein
MYEIPLIKFPHSESPIRPFIIAPIGDRQDQIILGSNKILKNHNLFINNLKISTEVDQFQYPFAKAFTTTSGITLLIVFPTNVTESSGRGGLYGSRNF